MSNRKLIAQCTRMICDLQTKQLGAPKARWEALQDRIMELYYWRRDLRRRPALAADLAPKIAAACKEWATL